ncbi:Sensor histidine kinase ComP [compost metagenome]
MFAHTAWAAEACAPHIDSVRAVRATAGAGPEAPPPIDGWQPVTLPDHWARRWPGFEGIVWYRIDWQRPCAGRDDAPQLGVAFDYLSMAGAISLNDNLLWRDASLVEPLSRSWNTPRVFFLPAAALNPGTNTLWVQVVGGSMYGSGLGRVVLGPADAAVAYHDERRLFARVLPAVNLVISITLGCFFLVLWLMRRQEVAYGWYALSAIAWLVFASNTVVSTLPWPFASTDAWSRWITAWMVLYVSCFCMFMWHFGGQRFPRLSRALWTVAALAVAAIALLPQPALSVATLAVFIVYSLLFMAVCVQFILRALDTKKTEHLLLALCAFGFLVAAVHDALMILRVIDDRFGYTVVTAPLIMIGMSLILAGGFTRSLRRVESFNDELAREVRGARTELADTLSREHRLELDNVRLHERLSVAHDLHDGLGSSLVRSIALVEQSGEALQRPQYLSMFKSLRDDLRQIIDTHSGGAAPVAATPTQWLAPMRHRFGRLFEEMGVRSHWQTPAAWPCALSARQVLGLTRLLEEALANVVKHSRARTLRVQLMADGEAGVLLSVEDDGVGFDAVTVASSIGGLGLRSMQARMARIGGTLQIDAGDGGTRLEARVRAPVMGAGSS